MLKRIPKIKELYDDPKNAKHRAVIEEGIRSNREVIGRIISSIYFYPAEIRQFVRNRHSGKLPTSIPMDLIKQHTTLSARQWAVVKPHFEAIEQGNEDVGEHLAKIIRILPRFPGIDPWDRFRKAYRYEFPNIVVPTDIDWGIIDFAHEIGEIWGSTKPKEKESFGLPEIFLAPTGTMAYQFFSVNKKGSANNMSADLFSGMNQRKKIKINLAFRDFLEDGDFARLKSRLSRVGWELTDAAANSEGKMEYVLANGMKGEIRNLEGQIREAYAKLNKCLRGIARRLIVGFAELPEESNQ